MKGLRILENLSNNQEDFDAKSSGKAEAVVLGVISEKIKIIIVRSIDPSKTLPSKKLIIIIVTIADAKILAKLFPTRITDNKLSGLDSNLSARFELLLPFLTLFLSFILFEAIIPVSDPEKNAERIKRNIKEKVNSIREGSSGIK